jgi:hypothetical protein
MNHRPLILQSLSSKSKTNLKCPTYLAAFNDAIDNIDTVKLVKYASEDARLFLRRSRMFRRVTPESFNVARKRVENDAANQRRSSR